VSAHNKNQFFHRDVETLRAETGNADAKAKAILAVQKSRSHKTGLLKKLSLSTLACGVIVVGGMTLLRPAVIASPTSVAKALREAMTYTIRSFTLDGAVRHLQSTTSVESGKKTTKFFGVDGKEVEPRAVPNSFVAQDLGKHLGLRFGSQGAIQWLGQSEVTKIRADISRYVKEISKNHLPKGKGSPRIFIDSNSEMKVFLNGAEIESSPEGLKKFGLNLEKSKDRKGSGRISLSNTHKNLTLIQGKDGKSIELLESGRTSAEYLQKLLTNESQWNVERGIELDGKRFDKFTLKSIFSPIELYVDPSTSLPRLLRFKSVIVDGMTIEDVYEYGNQPTRI
jgi:hypothetical protein